MLPPLAVLLIVAVSRLVSRLGEALTTLQERGLIVRSAAGNATVSLRHLAPSIVQRPTSLGVQRDTSLLSQVSASSFRIFLI
jgi:hypothetical protein